MTEFLVQTVMVIILLLLITWMFYRAKDEPHSEYGKLLDEIPDSYAHLSDEALQEEIVKAKKVLHRLEEELARLEGTKRARRHRIRKRIAAIRLALLHSEERNRQHRF